MVFVLTGWCFRHDLSEGRVDQFYVPTERHDILTERSRRQVFIPERIHAPTRTPPEPSHSQARQIVFGARKIGCDPVDTDLSEHPNCKGSDICQVFESDDSRSVALPTAGNMAWTSEKRARSLECSRVGSDQLKYQCRRTLLYSRWTINGSGTRSFFSKTVGNEGGSQSR